MPRLLLPALLALALALPSGAHAAQTNSLAGVRCEEPEVVEYITETMQEMVFSNQQHVTSLLDHRKISNVKTVRATTDTLICSLTVQFSYNGTPHTQRGRYTLKYFANGKISAQFAPNY
jgi:hypothetical protein